MRDLESLERAARDNPDDYGDRLATAYLEEGRPTDAIRLLKDLKPRSPERTILLAQGYFDNFDNGTAAKLLGSLPKEPTDSLRAQLLLGELAVEKGKTSEAKVHLHRVHSIAPNHLRAIELLTSLGETLDDEDTNAEALVGFNTDDPEREPLGRALLHIALGLVVFSGVFAVYAWQVSRTGAANGYVEQAAAHLDAGELRSAADAFQAALAVEAESPEAIAGMAETQALLWVEAKRPEAEVKAIEWLGRAQSMGLNIPQRWTAELLVGVGRGNPALLTRATERLAARPLLTPRMHHALGRARRLLGDKTNGLNALERAHRQSSGNPVYACAYARALSEDGQDATEVLAQAGECL